jgi:hypothetical protein
VTLALASDWPRLPGAVCSTHPHPEWWQDRLRHERDAAMRARQAQAVAVCGTCPVQAACAAARRDGDGGVWGGTAWVWQSPYEPAAPAELVRARRHHKTIKRLTLDGEQPAYISTRLGLPVEMVRTVVGELRLTAAEEQQRLQTVGVNPDTAAVLAARDQRSREAG